MGGGADVRVHEPAGETTKALSTTYNVCWKDPDVDVQTIQLTRITSAVTLSYIYEAAGNTPS